MNGIGITLTAQRQLLDIRFKVIYKNIIIT